MQDMNTRFTQLLMSSLLTLGFVGCAASTQEESVSKRTVNNSDDALGVDGLKVSIDFTGEKSGAQLRQVAVDEYVIDVTCGAETKHADISTGFSLDRGAQDCLVRLKSFTLEGVAYQAEAGKGFTTHAVNEVAEFTSLATDNTLFVKITDQLPADIQNNENVAFFYSEVDNFDDITPGTIDTRSIATTVNGEQAVEFNIASVIIDKDNDTIEIIGECKSQIVGADFDASECAGDRIKNIRLRLEDYPATVDKAFLDGAIGNGDELMDLTTEYVAVGTAGAANGGFKVTMAFDDMNLNDRILILSRMGTDSYLYGKIDIQ